MEHRTEDLQTPSQVEPVRGASMVHRVSLGILLVVVTLLIVLFILNYQRWVSLDFLVGDVRTRVVWALLIPLGIGVVLGFIGGRFRIRR